MKDQNTLEVTETDKDRYNRALDLFIESVIKPDVALRQCARNQKCYDELMDLRDDVMIFLNKQRWK